MRDPVAILAVLVEIGAIFALFCVLYYGARWLAGIGTATEPGSRSSVWSDSEGNLHFEPMPALMSGRSTVNYMPRGDRILIQRLIPPESKEGQLAMPTSQTLPPNEGIVVAVGPGLRNRNTGEIDSIDLELGAHVTFLEHSGYEIEVDGVTYLQMRDEEVNGVRLK